MAPFRFSSTRHLLDSHLQEAPSLRFIQKSGNPTSIEQVTNLLPMAAAARTSPLQKNPRNRCEMVDETLQTLKAAGLSSGSGSIE